MQIVDKEVFRPACDASSPIVGIKVHLDRDLTSLLPYIKGGLPRVRYYPKGDFAKFAFEGHQVTVDHNLVNIGGFESDDEARALADKVIDLLRDIEARKDEITPDTTPYVAPSMVNVLKLLPRKNGCDLCGYPTCMAFATALVADEAEPEACRPLADLPDGQERLAKLRDMLGL